jgi:hypothetical protein
MTIRGTRNPGRVVPELTVHDLHEVNANNQGLVNDNLNNNLNNNTNNNQGLVNNTINYNSHNNLLHGSNNNLLHGNNSVIDGSRNANTGDGQREPPTTEELAAQREAAEREAQAFRENQPYLREVKMGEDGE